MEGLDWSRLGRFARDRREALRLTRQELAERAEVATRTVQNLEEGRVPSGRTPSSYPRIERALGWESGSVAAVLRGGVPRLIADGVDLPRRLQAEFTDREVVDYDVLPFALDGDQRVVIMLVGPRAGEGADMEKLRRELEEFDRLRRRLRVQGRPQDER